jgi:dTDP-4-amino-4,6-dideoxygalactose transaminase
MAVPQSNPKASYDAHSQEIDGAISRVLSSGWYILGKEVEAFENEFAAFHGFQDSVGVGNGTDALELGLRAIGVGNGDLVFTVSHTAVATVAAIERAGAVPVLVDIDPATFTMDPQRLEDSIVRQKKTGTGRLRAIVVVHLYGHPAAMPELLAIAKAHGLEIVEDCAQAHGAIVGEHMVGTLGTIAAFSFYPTKNLGALGDGGAVLTKDARLTERVRLLREYGWRERYVSECPGGNSRLDEIQAAVLRVKLRGLSKDNEARRATAENYAAGIENSMIGLPVVRPNVQHVFHQFVVRCRDRDSLRDHLKQKGVGTLVHYPVPIHQQPAYAGRVAVPPHGLLETEKAAAEVLSFPMFPKMTKAQGGAVVEAVNAWKPTKA